jgi:hypothetical protein
MESIEQVDPSALQDIPPTARGERFASVELPRSLPMLPSPAWAGATPQKAAPTRAEATIDVVSPLRFMN